MSLANVLWLVFGIVMPIVTTALWMPLDAWRLHKRYRRVYNYRDFLRYWAGAAAVDVPIFWFLDPQPNARIVAIGCAFSGGIALLIRWYRRKPRRASQLIGAKTRALRDAVVDTMRRERRPSGVLRPVRER